MKNTSNVPLALILLITCTLISNHSFSQPSPSAYAKFSALPDKFFGGINKKSKKIQQDINKSTELYLKKISRQELKLQRRLEKKNGATTTHLFGNINNRYDRLRNVLYSENGQGQYKYSGHIDSMQTALQFLNKTKSLSQSPEVQAKLHAVFEDYANAQKKLNQSHFIHEKIKLRQQTLQQKLQNFVLPKDLRKYQEKAYYYRTQVDNHKKIFEKPGKLEATLLKAANKIPAFSKFFNNHSQLASLFRLPGNDDPTEEAFDGLQTRAMLNQELEQRLGTGPNSDRFMSESIANAQTELADIKNKINQSGSDMGDMEMPDLKPNQQKSKSILNRLELGVNIQNTKSNTWLPASTDFGISLGYKINSKALIGIGSSYKMGWGKSIRHISFSHEGAGIRTFYEMTLKGSFWISGGGEINYRSTFKRIEELRDYDTWQQSILVGISKKYQISKKIKGNIQLLYDFLHYRSVPRTQPVIFRVGYNFK